MNDDELRRQLNDAIPEPRADYWDRIHRRLAEVERSEEFDDLLDTDRPLGRLTVMENNNPSPMRGRVMFMTAAAALVLVVGAGAFSVINDDGDDSDSQVDVATQPDGAGQPASPVQGGADDSAGNESAGAPLVGGLEGVEFGDVASPVGGTVKKVSLAGAEVSVLVECDQGGFEPFLFTDQGRWIGCQLAGDATAGAESEFGEAVLEQVSSPVGGEVSQLVVPGPEVSVIVDCGAGLQPFLFTDQGTWIGCQS